MSMSQMGQDLALLAPVLAVLLTAVGSLSFEMLHLPKISLPFAVIGLLVAIGLALPLIGTETTVFEETYRVDDLSVWAVILLSPTTALTAILARIEVRDTDREGTVYSLLVFALLGALVLAGAGDMMLLVLGVLLSSLATFTLVAYPRDDRAPPRLR